MAQVSEETKAKVAELFFDSGLLLFGQFTLKSGLVAPHYIDLRKAQSHPDVFHAIVDAYSEMISDLDKSILLAGIPEAATSLASAVGYKLERALVQPRKIVKEHGTKSSVEGDFKEGDKVVLFDDLVTKGDSKIEAIHQVEGAGLKVEKLLILIDLEKGGLQTVRDAGYTIETVFTLSNLMDRLLKLGKLDQAQYQKSMDFIRQ